MAAASPRPAASAGTTTTAAEPRPRALASAAFAERFKYILCTSFLLTSSLSISFYSESHAYNHIDQLEAEDELLGALPHLSTSSSTASNNGLQRSSSSLNIARPFIHIASDRIRAERARPSPASDTDNGTPDQDRDADALLPTTVRCPAESFQTPTHAVQVILPAHLRSTSNRSPSPPLYASIHPPLSPPGYVLRNATALAVLILYPLSPSRALWFRSALVLVSLAWATVLLLRWHIGSTSSFLSHQLEYPPSLARKGLMDDAQPSADASAPNLGALQPPSTLDPVSSTTSSSSTTATLLPRQLLPPPMAAVSQLVVRRHAFHSALRLVRAAQRLDIELNRAIAAIQEVELVRRGYKLTYPMAPISRIESMPCACMLHSHAEDQRDTVLRGLSDANGRNYSQASSKDVSLSYRRLGSVPTGINTAHAGVANMGGGGGQAPHSSASSPAVDRRTSMVSSSTTTSSSPPTSMLSRDSQFSSPKAVGGDGGGGGRGGAGLRMGSGAGTSSAGGATTRESLVSPHTSLSSQAEAVEALAANGGAAGGRGGGGGGAYAHLPGQHVDGKPHVDWARSAGSVPPSVARSSVAGSQGEAGTPSRRISSSLGRPLSTGMWSAGFIKGAAEGAACTCQRRQLLQLRQTLVDVLRNVGDEAGQVSARLDPLVDEVELGLLQGMEGGGDKAGEETTPALEEPTSAKIVQQPTTADVDAASNAGTNVGSALDDAPPVDITPAPGQVSLSEELAYLAPGRAGGPFRGFGSTSTSSGDESPSGGSGANSLQRASEMAERRRARRAGLRGAAPPSAYNNPNGAAAANASTSSAPPISYNPLASAPNSASATNVVGGFGRQRNPSRPSTAESEPSFSLSGGPNPSNGSSRHVRRGSRLRYISDRPGSAMDQYGPSSSSAASSPGAGWGTTPVRRPGSSSSATSPAFATVPGSSGGARMSTSSHFSGGPAGLGLGAEDVSPAAAAAAASVFALASSSTSTAAAATRAVKRSSMTTASSSVGSAAGRTFLAQLRDATGGAGVGADAPGSGVGLAPGARASRDSWTSGREHGLSGHVLQNDTAAAVAAAEALGEKEKGNRETMRALEKLEGLFTPPPPPSQTLRGTVSLDQLGHVAAGAAAAGPTDLDALALISIRAGFQDMHRRRRDVLYRLLALEFEVHGRYVLVRRLGAAERGASERPARWSKVDLAEMATHNVALPTAEYWGTICRSMDALSSQMERHSAEVIAQVAREMGLEPGSDAGAAAAGAGAGAGAGAAGASATAGGSDARGTSSTQQSEIDQSHERVLTDIFGPQTKEALALARASMATRDSKDLFDRLRPAPCLVEAISGLGLALRTIQVKLHACSEDLGVHQAHPLHGMEAGLGLGVSAMAAGLAKKAVSAVEVKRGLAEQLRTEKVYAGIRDDLLRASSEWEAGMRIIRQQTVHWQRASASLSGTTALSPSDGTQAPNELVALSQRLSRFIEANGRSEGHSSSGHSQRSGPTSATAHPSALQSRLMASGATMYASPTDPGASTDSSAALLSSSSSSSRAGRADVDADLAQLMRQQTSPAYLPAPGPERLYDAEPHAGGGGGGGGGFSRHQQRPPRLSGPDAGAPPPSDASIGVGVVRELKDVISQRRSYLASSPAQPGLGSSPAQDGGFDGSFASTIKANDYSAPPSSSVASPTSPAAAAAAAAAAKSSSLSPPMFGMVTKRKSRRVPDDPSAVFEMLPDGANARRDTMQPISAGELAALKSQGRRGSGGSELSERAQLGRRFSTLSALDAGAAAAAGVGVDGERRDSSNSIFEPVQLPSVLAAAVANAATKPSTTGPNGLVGSSLAHNGMGSAPAAAASATSAAAAAAAGAGGMPALKPIEGRPLSVVTEDPWPVEHDEMPADAASAAAAAAAAAARQRWAHTGMVEEEHSYGGGGGAGLSPSEAQQVSAPPSSAGQHWVAF